MSISAIEISVPHALNVSVTDDTLSVELSDGRTISVPVEWYPRLVHGSDDERNNWRLIGRGEGIHWPDLDEDISVEGLLAGKPSGESQESFKKWLESRKARITSG
ncbi:MAG: DUF2442 domain-containing protein [Deltaproteobacteria bacterium]|nr:DUF2442 domain-containing protein [Deltaproteobacteria bacterium]MBW1960993.1 DUF2442 domain-containing protein [Deltaproteobacteria bacterium]MBW1992918.1 DUF2442 domain-containing protein [Deltaproteobacteria bacterium]MBW2152760.1 DUF2442 domain-containing protein [Deltaproteobacteria bacterium]